MSTNRIIPFVLTTLMLCCFFQSYAQSIKGQQGAILKAGSNLRISGANIKNQRSNFSVVSNELGIFTILSSAGDTLEVSAMGYMTKYIVVSNFQDVILYLQEITQLDEVVVNGKSLEADLNDIRNAYKSKGSYFSGKPPVLAYIFSPLSALGDRFGKTGKRARRFNNFASQELEYQEVTRKFNDLSINTAVPAITPEELPDFRSDYMPTLEQVRLWNEYDMVVYIRKSYNEFKAIKQQEKGTVPAP